MTIDKQDLAEREAAWEKIYEDDVYNLLIEGYELVRSTGKWLTEILDSSEIADEVMTLIYLRTMLPPDSLPSIRTLSRSYVSKLEEGNLYYPQNSALLKLLDHNKDQEIWKQLWPTIEETDSTDTLPNLYDSDWLLWWTHSMPVFIELLSYAKVGKLTEWKTGISKENGTNSYLDGLFKKAQRYESMIPTTWINGSDDEKSNAISVRANILIAAQTRRLLDEGKPVLADHLAILAQVHPKTVQNALSKNDLVLALPDKPGPTGSRKKPKYVSANSALHWLTNPKRGKNRYFPTDFSEYKFSSGIEQDRYSDSGHYAKIPMSKNGSVFLPYMYTKQGYLVGRNLYASYESALDALTKSDNPRWSADNPTKGREEYIVDSWIKMRNEDIQSLIASSPFTQRAGG